MNDSEHTLLIGVDGGGTGCRAAVGTAANGILATADGGRANTSSDFDLAINNIVQTVKTALQKAGLQEASLNNAVVHCGLAGVMTTQDSTRVSAALHFGTCIATDDRPTAVRGALGDQDGYLLSIGTGAIAARQLNGDFRSVGGWGFYVADQASGAWLGRAALERVLLCHDGLAEHSDLTRAIFARFDNDPNAISSFSITAKPGDYGAFSPEIVAGAKSGDPWGQSIMREGADHLQRCLAALGFKAGQVLCLTGGVGPHYADYLPPTTLSGLAPSRGSALDGAFQLAKDMAERRVEIRT